VGHQSVSFCLSTYFCRSSAIALRASEWAIAGSVGEKPYTSQLGPLPLGFTGPIVTPWRWEQPKCATRHLQTFRLDELCIFFWLLVWH
jgi:hypothetical protein